jgi:hypothetical protein
MAMDFRKPIASIAFAASLCVTLTEVFAQDTTKYPDWKGQWIRRIVPGLGGQPSLDQTKPWGFGQQAPLTDEYKAVLEASIVAQERGGQGNYESGYTCNSFGMPMITTAFYPWEIIITPETTHILINHQAHTRRIYTDGRDWPTGPREQEPTLNGYSIGKWIDSNGDGRYDTLEIETRGPFKGPRTYDSTGLPLHHDNRSVFKERYVLDATNPNVLHNEITVIDNALTRPWTVDKQYVRNPDPRPFWIEDTCETNEHVKVGKENYFISADGFLMPVRKDQPPPDLRYFNQTRK